MPASDSPRGRIESPNPLRERHSDVRGGEKRGASACERAASYPKPAPAVHTVVAAPIAARRARPYHPRRRPGPGRRPHPMRRERMTKRMRIGGLVALALGLLLPRAAAATGAPREHDGFFLRASAGIGTSRGELDAAGSHAKLHD